MTTINQITIIRLLLTICLAGFAGSAVRERHLKYEQSAMQTLACNVC